MAFTRDLVAEIAELEAAVAGDTAPKALLRTVEHAGDAVALRRMDDRAPGGWLELTYRQLLEQCARVANGLAAAGVQAGDRVVLMMRNRPEFHVVDIAAQVLRATSFSIYNSSSSEEVQYQASHSEASVAILENASFLAKFLEVRDQLPALRAIYVIDPPAAGLPDGVLSYDELFSHGEADLAALVAATQPADLATLIYTSGTTGPPKGVMIDQHNVVYTCLQLRRCIADEDLTGLRIISYLPMAHIAERITSHYMMMLYGYTVTCCPDPGQIAMYAREVHPEMMFGVPRVWEKVYNGVNAALAGDPDRKRQFDDGVTLAKQIKAAERDGTVTQEQRDTLAFLDAVAFSTVRQLVGLDAIRVAISGAAPIPKEIIEWFQATGVNMSEIYGMSESTGPMTWEPYRLKPGTVGPPIPGCEVVIAPDGEIICRGGNVFRGYYKDEVKTAEALIDGWLHSGDIGEMDDDGYVKIVDRKKELIITAGGKNISPANLEAALKSIPLVGQACAVGDNRKFVSAILVLDPEYAPVWAKANGFSSDDLSALADDPAVVAEVQRGVDQVNDGFAQVEQIKRFILLGEEWLPDSDVLTPTSKLKRRGILARYGAAIDALYE